jgi:hypothetical protein
MDHAGGRSKQCVFYVAGIIAKEDGTNITIEFSKTMQPTGVSWNGRTFGYLHPLTVTLGAFQTFQVQSLKDLTGSRVTSGRPIVVVAGSSRAIVGYRSGSTDHLEEMLPPLFAWGKHFLTVPIAGRVVGDLVRVVGKCLRSE